MTMELTPRLKTVYEMSGSGGCIIDVGTDHGYLPIKLLSDGKYKTAFMTDVAEGPLSSARENAAAAGNKPVCASFFLSAGFSSVPEPEGDFSVSICGMGGELIASILDDAPEWIRRADVFVLQPMTKDEKLRAYLWEHGFEITLERAVTEGKKVYIALAARYAGENAVHTEPELYVGKAMTLEQSDDMERRLERLCERYTKIGRASGEGKYLSVAAAANAVLELLRRKR